nr:skin secretory protein xP2-like [Symphalangus syndactylus]
MAPKAGMTFLSGHKALSEVSSQKLRPCRGGDVPGRSPGQTFTRRYLRNGKQAQTSSRSSGDLEELGGGGSAGRGADRPRLHPRGLQRRVGWGPGVRSVRVYAAPPRPDVGADATRQLAAGSGSPGKLTLPLLRAAPRPLPADPFFPLPLGEGPHAEDPAAGQEPSKTRELTVVTWPGTEQRRPSSWGSPPPPLYAGVPSLLAAERTPQAPPFPRGSENRAPTPAFSPLPPRESERRGAGGRREEREAGAAGGGKAWELRESALGAAGGGLPTITPAVALKGPMGTAFDTTQTTLGSPKVAPSLGSFLNQRGPCRCLPIPAAGGSGLFSTRLPPALPPIPSTPHLGPRSLPLAGGQVQRPLCTSPDP